MTVDHDAGEAPDMDPRPDGGFYQSVVAAIDGSDISVEVLKGAAAIATQIDSEVTLLTAGSAGVDLPHVAEAVEAADLEDPLDVEFVGLDDEHPTTADAILGYAANLPLPLLVMGSHGRSGLLSVLLGSVSGEVVQKSHKPVLLYGPRATGGTAYSRVVACLDGSDFSEEIVTEATAWAKALDLPLWLIEVVEPDAGGGAGIETNYVHNIARRLQDSGLDLEWDVLHSKHPQKAILDWVGDDPTTIIAISTHGRTGLERVLLGSVAADVIHGAAGPVITCVPAK